MMVLLAVLNYLYEIRFAKFISLFNSNEYFIDYINKSASIFNVFDMTLLLFQIGTYSLLIFKVNEYLFFIESTNQFLLFLKINLFLFIFYLFRYLIGKIIAVILEMSDKQGLLSFVKLSYLSKVTIIVYPAIIVLYYSPWTGLLFLKIILLLTTVFLLFKYIQIIKHNQKLIFSNLFYFILYLCALEIAPLIYVFKLFINKG